MITPKRLRRMGEREIVKRAYECFIKLRYTVDPTARPIWCPRFCGSKTMFQIQKRELESYGGLVARIPKCKYITTTAIRLDGLTDLERGRLMVAGFKFCRSILSVTIFPDVIETPTPINNYLWAKEWGIVK